MPHPVPIAARLAVALALLVGSAYARPVVANITGVVEKLSIAACEDAGSCLYVHIRTGSAALVIADLGPIRSLDAIGFTLAPGDRIQVRGVQGSSGNDAVILAEKIVANGRSVNVQRLAKHRAVESRTDWCRHGCGGHDCKHHW